jgi:hypothetical protein
METDEGAPPKQASKGGLGEGVGELVVRGKWGSYIPSPNPEWEKFSREWDNMKGWAVKTGMTLAQR